jgi:hypothetical protein
MKKREERVEGEEIRSVEHIASVFRGDLGCSVFCAPLRISKDKGSNIG